MSETVTPEALVASLTAALDEEEAAAKTALERRQIAAHREIVDRYAETLRDYARTLERARGGPIGNADLDDLEAELPVLRSIVEIIAGIYADDETG